MSNNTPTMDCPIVNIHAYILSGSKAHSCAAQIAGEMKHWHELQFGSDEQGKVYSPEYAAEARHEFDLSKPFPRSGMLTLFNLDAIPQDLRGEIREAMPTDGFYLKALASTCRQAGDAQTVAFISCDDPRYVAMRARFLRHMEPAA